jgi:hypothetical protein
MLGCLPNCHGKSLKKHLCDLVKHQKGHFPLVHSFVPLVDR